jgi:hypothetical protein
MMIIYASAQGNGGDWGSDFTIGISQDQTSAFDTITSLLSAHNFERPARNAFLVLVFAPFKKGLSLSGGAEHPCLIRKRIAF